MLRHRDPPCWKPDWHGGWIECGGHKGLAGLCGEVNDPYRRCDVNEHLDGFSRLSLWNRFGFGLLDFPYVQPPLSRTQQAVVGIALIFQPMRDDLRERLPSDLVERIVREFQIWAMRCGFTRIPINYLQPQLHTDTVGISDETPLDLLYKPFGRIYDPPALSLTDLKRDLIDIFMIVYRLKAGDAASHLEKIQWPANASNMIESAG